jgi:hypothetical protein
MEKKYTYQDYLDAKEASEKANQSFGLQFKKQAKLRGEIDKMTKKLDKELAPFEKETEKARDHLTDLSGRLLGSWQDSPGWSSMILQAGSIDKCWGRRVWLRIVARDERNPRWWWEVNIDGRSKGGISVVFEPDVVEKRAEIFARLKKKVETMLVDMGYILTSETE